MGRSLGAWGSRRAGRHCAGAGWPVPRPHCGASAGLRIWGPDAGLFPPGAPDGSVVTQRIRMEMHKVDAVFVGTGGPLRCHALGVDTQASQQPQGPARGTKGKHVKMLELAGPTHGSLGREISGLCGDTGAVASTTQGQKHPGGEGKSRSRASQNAVPTGQTCWRPISSYGMSPAVLPQLGV